MRPAIPALPTLLSFSLLPLAASAQLLRECPEVVGPAAAAVEGRVFVPTDAAAVSFIAVALREQEPCFRGVRVEGSVDGAYRIGGLPPGVYHVVAYAAFRDSPPGSVGYRAMQEQAAAGGHTVCERRGGCGSVRDDREVERARGLTPRVAARHRLRDVRVVSGAIARGVDVDDWPGLPLYARPFPPLPDGID